MEFNCTNTNYITSVNPSTWGKPLSSFSYSYRGDLHGLQTQLSAWLTCEGLSVSDHQFSEQFGPEDRRTAAPSENSTYLQDQVSTTFLFPGSCLTGCCSTNSCAQFNSLRLGSSYKTPMFNRKGVFLLPCAVSELVGLMTRFASSWRAPNQSFSLEARFLSSLSVQARKEQSTRLSQEHQGKTSPQRVH